MTMMLPKIEGYQRAKLSAVDFWTLADAGAFEGFAKTELIEGELYVVNSVHFPHARAQGALTGELMIAVKQHGLALRVLSNPSTDLAAASVPEPDIALARDTDQRALPGSNLQLAVEISDSTLSFDLGEKLGVYARAGIPEYWVVDVNARVIHRHSKPSNQGYADIVAFQFGETIPCATIDGLLVDTASLT
jgi:Uma2 family endonuclease